MCKRRLVAVKVRYFIFFFGLRGLPNISARTGGRATRTEAWLLLEEEEKGSRRWGANLGPVLHNAAQLSVAVQ